MFDITQYRTDPSLAMDIWQEQARLAFEDAVNGINWKQESRFRIAAVLRPQISTVIDAIETFKHSRVGLDSIDQDDRSIPVHLDEFFQGTDFELSGAKLCSNSRLCAMTKSRSADGLPEFQNKLADCLGRRQINCISESAVSFDLARRVNSLHDESHETSSPPSPPPLDAPLIKTIVPRRKTISSPGRVSPNTPVDITMNLLETLHGLPLPVAARSIGVSSSAFKKACRRLGVHRWHYQRGPGRSASKMKRSKRSPSTPPSHELRCAGACGAPPAARADAGDGGRPLTIALTVSSGEEIDAALADAGGWSPVEASGPEPEPAAAAAAAAADDSIVLEMLALPWPPGRGGV
jgi:hypothetical protein